MGRGKFQICSKTKQNKKYVIIMENFSVIFDFTKVFLEKWNKLTNSDLHIGMGGGILKKIPDESKYKIRR